jgi:carbon-monoxide dehydrogenase medium subunit
MIPGSFDYHRPKRVSEALTLLAQFGSEARVVAGGHSLIPMMKLRLAAPEHLVDLQDIGELKGVSEDKGTLTIGAMTTQAELVASSLVAAHCPVLREAALQIADPQVRNCGTVGGNVANGDPGNDLPAVMQALDAVYRLAGKAGTREVRAREFYQGALVTALQEDEILTAVRIGPVAKGHGYSYMKQKRKVGDYATAAAAAILTLESSTCRTASIALTNVGDTPLYAGEACQILMGTKLDDAAIRAAAKAAQAIARPASDGRGSAEYRTKVAGVMVRRAIEQARKRAG